MTLVEWSHHICANLGLMFFSNVWRILLQVTHVNIKRQVIKNKSLVINVVHIYYFKSYDFHIEI